MSIWIDLMFMHGHFATPRALEHLLTPAAEPAAPAGTGDLPPEPEMDDEEARQQWELLVSDPAPYMRLFPVVHHPFRTIGQLP
jgi:hypothetical protein